MVGAQISPVLLVGDVAPRLQGELALQGLPCAVAFDQNEAVARMRATSFPFVVVPTVFGDGYSGVTFTQGLLQYFDTQVIVYGNGLEQQDLSALLRTGRVAHFPGDAEGKLVADFLARRTRGNSNPPRAASPAQPFNLTPGGPAAMPPGGGFPPAPTTDPTLSPAFFGSVGTSSVPRPPTMGPSPGVTGPTLSPMLGGGGFGAPVPTPAPQPDGGSQRRLEAVVDELVRTQAELQALKGHAAQAEQERAALLVEVEAARRSSLAQVAEVMALSDEGDPISEELEQLRARTANLETEQSAARAEVEMLRAERERLVADALAQSAILAEARAQADAAAARAEAAAAEAQAARAELSQASAEVSSVRGDLERARAEAGLLRGESAGKRQLEEELTAAHDELARMRAEQGALAQQHEEQARVHAEQAALAQQLQAELAQARADRDALDQQLKATAEQATQQARATADEGAAQRVESDKLRGDLAAARTDATTLRLDLQEATMRLDEATQELAKVGAERDALRSEAAPLRDWGNQLVVEHARQQEELEKMRVAWGKLEERSRLVDEVQAQLQAMTAERDKLKAQGGGASADVEVVMARARQLAALVGALEPFMWGLTQASHFFTKNPVDGGEQHIKLLQQLQGVLLRLRDEIAMLDLG